MAKVNLSTFDKCNTLCRLCVYSKIQRGVGIVCSLTFEQPDFYIFCPSFKVFHSRDKKIHENPVVSYSNNDVIYAILLIVLTIGIFSKFNFYIIFASLAVSILGISIYKRSLPPFVGQIGWFPFVYFITLKVVLKNKTITGWAEDMIIKQQIQKAFGYESIDFFERIMRHKTDNELQYIEKYAKKLDLAQRIFVYSMATRVFVYNNAEDSLKITIIDKIFSYFKIPEKYKNLKLNYVDEDNEYKKRIYDEQKREREQQNESHLIYSNDSESYYKILGLNSKAADKQITKRFRELAMLYHPDRYVNNTEKEKIEAQEKFKVISEAYNNIKKIRRI